MATRKYQAGGGYTNTTPGQMMTKPPMKKGGSTKKYQDGGSAPVTGFEKRQARKTRQKGQNYF